MRQLEVVKRPLSHLEQGVILTAIVGPILAVVVAFADAVMTGSISRFNIVAFLVTYPLFGLVGVTLGLHRYFTHGSFKTSWLIKVVMGVCALMAVQGQIKEWVANHLCHHVYSDQPLDLHSPNLSEEIWSGFWHSHTGWMIKSHLANQEKFLPRRILEDRTIAFLDRTFVFWIMLSFGFVPMIAWFTKQSGHEIWMAFVWSAVRVFTIHHITWGINSICHMFGSRAFETSDQSRNNLLLGILAFGEGWHNNHHRFQSAHRHGMFPGQFDATARLIEVLEPLHLVWDVRQPSKEDIARALKERAAAA